MSDTFVVEEPVKVVASDEFRVRVVVVRTLGLARPLHWSVPVEAIPVELREVGAQFTLTQETPAGASMPSQPTFRVSGSDGDPAIGAKRLR